MPVSSVSSFEHFALKVKAHVKSRLKEIEEESHAYISAKEKETESRIAHWLENAYAEWEQEYHQTEQHGYNTIRETANKKWSRFKEEQMHLLKERLTERLEAVFPEFAVCFIDKISEQYSSGTFILPSRYASLVNDAQFALEISEKDEVIFIKGNLYIEYSVGRIIEELEEEIISRMHLEETVWQA